MEKKKIKLSAMQQMIYLIEMDEPIMPITKKELLELEKLQLIHAYNLDPDLMKLTYRNGSDWYKHIYGL